MTQEELGSILGIGKAAVQKIESGQNANIRADKIILLCQTFRILPYALLADSFLEFWESVFKLKLDLDEIGVKDARSEAALTLVLDEHYRTRRAYLMRSLHSLNDEGVERAITYMDDLLKIQEYQKGSQE